MRDTDKIALALAVVGKMASLEIAKLTDKRHYHVLRDIDTMLARIEDTISLDELCFKETTYLSKGHERRMYELGEELTFALIAGYNSEMRYRVMRRWKELRALITSGPLGEAR